MPRKNDRALLEGVQDRRLKSADKPLNGITSNRVVDSPDNTMLRTDPETGLPIAVELDDQTNLPRRVATVVTASLRGDPLGRLHRRGHISDAEYAAGHWLQAQFELLGRSTLRGVDITRPQVDGGRLAREPITGAHQRAAKNIIVAAKELGREGFALVRGVLNERKFIEQLAGEHAGERGVKLTERDVKYFGRRFRECLNTLAHLFGFVARAPRVTAPSDSHRIQADAASNAVLHRAMALARADLKVGA